MSFFNSKFLKSGVYFTVLAFINSDAKFPSKTFDVHSICSSPHLPVINHSPEADDLPSDNIVRRLMLHHQAYARHLISFHHAGILSSHVIMRKEGMNTV